MKTSLFSALFLFCILHGSAQSIERKVVNTIGQEYAAGNFHLRVSAGEPIIGSKGATVKLSQGIFTSNDAQTLTAVTDISSDTKVAISPNPATNTIHVRSDEENLSAQITDIIGRTVKSKESVTESLYIGGLPSGLYIVSIYSKDDRLIHSSKIIKE